MALEQDLEVIPVINKIDLPSADAERTRAEIEDVIGIDASGAVPASAKEGIGITEILEAVVKRVPPPKGDPAAPLKALMFDSWYDSYRGVVMLVRVLEGTLRNEAGDSAVSATRKPSRCRSSACSARSAARCHSCRLERWASSSPA